MKKTVFALSIFGLTMIPVAATAARCDGDSIQGNWQRIGKDGRPMDAVWQFQPDMQIACTGDCARAAGLPVSYTLSRSRVSLQFEKGRMHEARCRVRNSVMTFGGGTQQGGFTFQLIE